MSQPRILVAEDESIIALDLCDTVKEAGYSVEGPHADVNSAMLACQKGTPDIAILDVELDDGTVYPLAERLVKEDIPIIFHSGRRSTEEMKARFPGVPTLSKPCPPKEMIEAVHTALASA